VRCWLFLACFCLNVRRCFGTILCEESGLSRAFALERGVSWLLSVVLCVSVVGLGSFRSGDRQPGFEKLFAPVSVVSCVFHLNGEEKAGVAGESAPLESSSSLSSGGMVMRFAYAEH